jgi:uncharacterized RDD family membrane protein YckC
LNDKLHHEELLGLDNIRLELPIASVGSRSLAAFLDYLVVAVLAFAWVLFCAFVLSAAGTWAIVAAFLGFFVLEWGYFALSEIAGGGRTLGKRAAKLRVVTAEGGSPGAGALLARNLVRSLDLVFGIPLMAIDPLSRRLGDRLGGTLVVHERRAEAPTLLLGRVPPGWGAREVAAVESFLSRARGLESEVQTYRMADRILDRLRRDAPDLLSGVDPRSNPVEAIRRALQVEEG